VSTYNALAVRGNLLVPVTLALLLLLDLLVLDAVGLFCAALVVCVLSILYVSHDIVYPAGIGECPFMWC